MFTLRDILSRSESFLEENKLENPRRHAELLVCDILAMKRIDLYMNIDKPLNEQEITACRDALMRRARKEPLEYISGKAAFYGCELAITPAVLIPRQETELLVDIIATDLKDIDTTGKVLWDICCGSGCIGIALKKKFPELTVHLSDVSSKALEIAEYNAEKNDAAVIIHCGDLLAPFAGKYADFVTCNPPYIPQEEYDALDSGVRDYEPQVALCSGATGLEIYQRLAAELPHHMNKGGKTWMEMGYNQGEDIAKIFTTPAWSSCDVKDDLSGHNRFFIASSSHQEA
jgi:release factor glutamine methyltransferase